MLVKRPETFFPILLRELSAPNLQIEPIPPRNSKYLKTFVKKLSLKLIMNRSINLRLLITIDNPLSPMYKLSFRNFVTLSDEA